MDPAAVSDEMRAWVSERVPEGPAEPARARRLLAALLDPDGLGIRYDASVTGTAGEVFESRRANCLGFTHLFVGLGRALGLPVFYLGFEQRPRYEKEGDLVVVWEHVTAGLGEIDNGLVLRFELGPDIDYSDPSRIADLTAKAMHFSNLGAEALRAGDLESAEELLEIAVALDPSWAHAWVNLGVVRRRSADLAGAESAYRRALAAQAGHPQAYSNLAMLFRLQGRRDAADAILDMLDREGSRDPYIYLMLGDASAGTGRVDEARRYYRRALRLGSADGEPEAALGLLALEAGRPATARRWLKRAMRAAPGSDRVERLRRELERAAGGRGSKSGAAPRREKLSAPGSGSLAGRRESSRRVTMR